MHGIDFGELRRRLSEQIRLAGFRAYLVTRQGGLHYLLGVFMPWRGVALVTANGEFCLFYWSGDASRIRREGAPAEIIEYAYDDLYEKVRSKLLQLGIRDGDLAVDLSLPGNAQPKAIVFSISLAYVPPPIVIGIVSKSPVTS